MKALTVDCFVTISYSSRLTVSPFLPVCQTAKNISVGFSKTVLSANRNNPCPRSNFEQASTSDFTRSALVVTVSTRKRWKPVLLELPGDFPLAGVRGPERRQGSF